MKYQTIVGAVCALIIHSSTAALVTFETVTLPGTGYWNGSDASGGITVDGVTFNNSYSATYGSWSGFAVSNRTDVTTPGFGNQYSAFTGGGMGGSANYAVGYYSTFDPDTTFLSFASLTNLAGKGAYLSNTTYGALDMLSGGSFGSKKFGGASGDDPDWFKLTLAGFAGVNATGTVDFYLADFRSTDKSKDYIVSDWRFVDLSALGSVDRIKFTMSSSDNGDFGMNTPSYFAIDNVLAVPEPSSLMAALAGLGLLVRRKR
jgi:Domain of unknown function (DUF4465)